MVDRPISIIFTVHRATAECDAACGIKTNDLSFDFTVDREDLEGCKLCWRAGCAVWVAAEIVDSSASSDNEVSAPVEGSAIASDIADLADLSFLDAADGSDGF